MTVVASWEEEASGSKGAFLTPRKDCLGHLGDGELRIDCALGNRRCRSLEHHSAFPILTEGEATQLLYSAQSCGAIGPGSGKDHAHRLVTRGFRQRRQQQG